MSDLARVRELLGTGGVTEALAILREVVRVDPGNVESRMLLAEALAAAGDGDRAVRELKALVERSVGDGFLVTALKAQRRLTELCPEDRHELARLAQLTSEAEEFSRRSDRPSRARRRPTIEIRYPRLRMGLFASLSDEAWDELVDALPARRFAPGDVIVREGSRDSSLYLVAMGEVRVVTEGPGGQEIVLTDLMDGDVFGEISLLRGVPRVATVVARSRVEILELTRPDFLRLSAASPALRGALDELARTRFLEWRKAKDQDEG